MFFIALLELNLDLDSTIIPVVAPGRTLPLCIAPKRCVGYWALSLVFLARVLVQVSQNDSVAMGCLDGAMSFTASRPRPIEAPFLGPRPNGKSYPILVVQ